MNENVTVRIDADTAPFTSALENLERLSERFGSQLTNALKSAVVSGRTLEDVLRRLALNLASMALSQGLAPLQNLLGGLMGRMVSGFMPALPFAKGGVVPFASGGVVTTPTYFPMRGATGLMGEAGAEAILPLQRGADGRLGVATTGQQAGGIHIVFNVSTPDPPAFRKSEAQISGMLARAVSRGRRTF